MSRVIWKFYVPFAETPTGIPEGARFLDVGAEGDSVALWALVRPDAELVSRWIWAVPTGVDVRPFEQHLGTVRLASGLIAHVFEFHSPARRDYWPEDRQRA